MLAQWTGDVVGDMHTYQISFKELSSEIGWNEKYLSVVLNGHKTPKGAEQKVRDALEKIKKRKEAEA